MSMNQKPLANRGWRGDWFASCEVLWQSWQIVVPLIGLISSCLILAVISWTKRDRTAVIVYTSQDQVFAEPILKEFTKQTGIKVRAVYDSEAVKTVGLANRLLAENNHPQCDVFWNNEELRTRQIAAQNTFRETNSWAALGFRTAYAYHHRVQTL